MTTSLCLTVFDYISRYTLQCYHTGLSVTFHAEAVLTCILLALLTPLVNAGYFPPLIVRSFLTGFPSNSLSYFLLAFESGHTPVSYF